MEPPSNVVSLRPSPAPFTGGGPEWRPVTPEIEDGREILGMDERGRVRLCKFYGPRGVRPRPGWISLEDCTDFVPLFFVPCPDRGEALEAIFVQQQATHAGAQ